MIKQRLKLIIFSVLLVVGIIILINSINLSSHEMTNIMKAHGGSMSTEKYLIYLEQSIEKNKSIGLILSVLGGVGVITSLNNESKKVN